MVTQLVKKGFDFYETWCLNTAFIIAPPLDPELIQLNLAHSFTPVSVRTALSLWVAVAQVV
jgi:hypothetical protein